MIKIVTNNILILIVIFKHVCLNWANHLLYTLHGIIWSRICILALRVIYYILTLFNVLHNVSRSIEWIII